MEKNTQKTGLYSTPSKLLRGFLCMLTFCVFISGLVISVYSIYRFGEEIVINPKGDYYASSSYQVDMSLEIQDVMRSLDKVVNNKDIEKFSIIDVGNNKKYNYNIEDISNDYNVGNLDEFTLTKLKPYETSDDNVNADLIDFRQAKSFLSLDKAKGSYLYFDKNTFINLFTYEGLQNINHCFSDKFSEESYFVFDDKDGKMFEQGILTEDTIDYNVDKFVFAEEIISNIYFYDASMKYDISEVGYAVYNPEEDLFYSTWDDYFEPYESYIYSAYELAETIKENNITTARTNSLLLPVLWSYNYAQSDFAGKIYNSYYSYNIGKTSLEYLQNSGLVYNLSNEEMSYGNAEAKDIMELEHAYRLTGSKVGADEDSDLDKNVKALTDYTYINEIFSNLPSDTTFFFGVDTQRDAEEISLITVNEKIYASYVKWSRAAIVIAFITFILLLIQAGYLIRTTGRNSKEDKEVHLNGFDKLPTELWFIIIGIVLAIPVIVCGSMHFPNEPVALSVTGVLGTLPFAFFFMIFSLSFARRIKGHNLWSKVVIRKISRHTGEVLKEFYRNRKGTEKLLVMFLGYAILEIICVSLIYELEQKEIVFAIFLLLQIAMLVVILLIIRDIKKLTNGVNEITKGNLDYKVYVNEYTSLFKELNNGINHIGDGLKTAVETSLKDERMKTELITNVSHDLKTPLTSIINYIDLLKKEPVQTEAAEHYLEVLESKAQRLKHLTEDLVEAAKANTGNIELEKMPLAFDELMKQAVGEFEDKFAMKNLEVVAHYPMETAVILADGRRLFRIIENVLQNAYKYAMPGTRIYADLSNSQGVVTFILKNISAAPLNISPEELVERFTRGDSARTTEGSGLGLSIAKDLTVLQDGTFDIILDGDLFKVVITFPEYERPEIVEVVGMIESDAEDEMIEEEPLEEE